MQRIRSIFRKSKNDEPRPVARPKQMDVEPPTQAHEKGAIKVEPIDTISIGPARAIVIGPSDHTVTVIKPSKSTHIAPPDRPAWDERGWSQSGEHGHEVYQGWYQVRDRNGQPRQYPGRIEMNGGIAQPFIHEPPSQVKDHPKGVCFNHKGDGWFIVHWHTPATNPSDAMLYVERVLHESLNH